MDAKLATPHDFTLVTGAAHNPSEPRHFMRIKPVSRRVRVLRDGAVLADSTAAVRLLEVGKDLYDPVFYFPRNDVTGALKQIDHSTHCPLKGDATYFDLTGDDGAVVEEKIAWSYPTPLDFAADLSGLIAFYGDKVTVEESPL